MINPQRPNHSDLRSAVTKLEKLDSDVPGQREEDFQAVLNASPAGDQSRFQQTGDYTFRFESQDPISARNNKEKVSDDGFQESPRDDRLPEKSVFEAGPLNMQTLTIAAWMARQGVLTQAPLVIQKFVREAVTIVYPLNTSEGVLQYRFTFQAVPVSISITREKDDSTTIRIVVKKQDNSLFEDLRDQTTALTDLLRKTLDNDRICVVIEAGASDSPDDQGRESEEGHEEKSDSQDNEEMEETHG